MATYQVEQRSRSHYVIGLTPEWAEDGDKDTMLIYHYPGGDVDTRMKDAHMMYAALYDLFQVQDNLKDGDVFQTEFGTYHCEGVHVVPDFEMGPDPRENQRDNVHY